MQVYGSIIPGAATLARLLPKGASEAREKRPYSREAKKRLAAVRWHETHGKRASLTARHYGLSRSTVYDWLRRYDRRGPRGLEDRSRRPKRVRQPAWSPELEQAVLALRREHPRWGKDKLTPILRREGAAVSVSMVGRILSRLGRQGRLPPVSLTDPCIVRRSQIRPYAIRKPKTYLPQAPWRPRPGRYRRRSLDRHQPPLQALQRPRLREPLGCPRCPRKSHRSHRHRLP